jgi:hypothetical protein
MELEQLKLKLIETQMALLQYQHKEVSENIARLTQAEFDKQVDSHNMPTGQTKPKDEFTGD